MSGNSRRTNLGVDWHLPKTGGGFERRPFASTTKATSDLIGLLADDGHTWVSALDAILYDPEAKVIAAAFVDAGHGDTPLRDHVAR